MYTIDKQQDLNLFPSFMTEITQTLSILTLFNCQHESSIEKPFISIIMQYKFIFA